MLIDIGCFPFLVIKVEVVAEGQSAAVHGIHAVGGEGGHPVPGSVRLEARTGHRSLLPEPRPVLFLLLGVQSPPCKRALECDRQTQTRESLQSL